MTAMYMPGATAVGITYNGGLVLASERRIAYGNFVVSKTTKKTFHYKFQHWLRLEKWRLSEMCHQTQLQR